MKITSKYRNFIVFALFFAISQSRADSAKTCPVTGDELGGDKGAPISVVYNGRTILLCCKTCLRKFNANPEKYAPKAEPTKSADAPKDGK